MTHAATESVHRPGPLALHDLWETALARMATKVSPQNFDMWLRPIEFVSDDAGTLQLRAPNSYVRLWFESNYLETILDEIRTVSGVPIRVEFVADRPAAAPRVTTDEPAADVEPAVAEAAPVASPGPASDLTGWRTAPLNPRYSFDTFVAGPSNQLAFAASQAAGSAFPPKYNPVFICGGVGLGKTHLLHAIGHTQLGLRPDARIAYISSERFMNEYVNAIRAGKMQEFRTRYREGIDVLLVDDVQFLAGKDGTQDEFFHTFNALHDNHKQIVLTADRKPHEIADIADRLRTRFAWGLLADIEPPELEVRIAILRKKALVEAIPLPDDVAMFIATSIKSNVRELEGALIRLAAYASLSKRDIDLAFAQETLGGSLARPREHITCETVIKAVAAYYGVKAADLKSERRHRSIAGPRAVAMYLARQHTKDSYPDLGRGFGGKHHTTVISAVEKITSKLGDDPGLRGEIHAIEATLLR
ncbi:MAG: chromosomal replication initiator protein DnaA [Kofleriaceae bacterium]